MREKVAAEKAGTASAVTSSQTFKPKPAFTSSTISTASVSSFKSATSHVSTASVSSFKSASSQVKKTSPSKPHQSPLKNKGLKQVTDPGNKIPATKAEEKPLSPMQTYEMSDREESESSEDESDDESRDKPKKAVSSHI